VEDLMPKLHPDYPASKPNFEELLQAGKLGKLKTAELEQLAIRLVAQNPCSTQADIREMLRNEVIGRIRERWVPPNMRNLTDA